MCSPACHPKAEGAGHGHAADGSPLASSGEGGVVSKLTPVHFKRTCRHRLELQVRIKSPV